MARAMQDVIKIQCFGCGALNEQGLQIKSFWAGDEVVCAWRPKPHHIGHPGILYGGLIASVVDCHCIWTASAHAYRRAGLQMADELRFTYVTGGLSIRYKKPVPIEHAVELRARVAQFDDRKTIVTCTVTSGGVTRAEAEVVAVPLPAEAQARRPAATCAPEGVALASPDGIDLQMLRCFD